MNHRNWSFERIWCKILKCGTKYLRFVANLRSSHKILSNDRFVWICSGLIHETWYLQCTPTLGYNTRVNYLWIYTDLWNCSSEKLYNLASLWKYYQNSWEKPFARFLQTHTNQFAIWLARSITFLDRSIWTYIGHAYTDSSRPANLWPQNPHATSLLKMNRVKLKQLTDFIP